MFEITPLGVPLLLAGMVYLVFASRTLLKDRRPAMSVGDDPREYTLEMVVEEGSPLAGRTIEEAGLRGLEGLFLMEIDRGGHFLAPVAPTERLEEAPWPAAGHRSALHARRPPVGADAHRGGRLQ
jgi:di/tricarboxylate transporter